MAKARRAKAAELKRIAIEIREFATSKIEGLSRDQKCKVLEDASTWLGAMQMDEEDEMFEEAWAKASATD